MGRKPPSQVARSLPIDKMGLMGRKEGKMSSLEKETKKEIARLERMIKKIDEFKEQAPQGCLVRPLLDEKAEIIKRWQEENYEKNNAYSENLRYETEQGELVRSKSEVIIANLLYRHREDILYKYERPLSVVVAGVSKTIYPDFTILNLHTGKITYWEHAGLMDDVNYANDFVRKVNTYTSNNLLPGRDVVFSYETQEIPLEISVIRKMVEEIRRA